MEAKVAMNEWKRIKAKLKNSYPELSDTDLGWGRVAIGDLQQNIFTKLGKTKKDLMNIIESYN